MSYDVKVVRLVLAPTYRKLFLQQHNNLGKLMNWWKNHLNSWRGVYVVPNNLKIKKNNIDCTLIITYECAGNTQDEDIYDENELIADPDDDGNYPIYYDDANNKILYIDPLKLEYVNASIDRKSTVIAIKKKAGLERKIVSLEINPDFSKHFLEKANNLGKLLDWWKYELGTWTGVYLEGKNLKIKKSKLKNSIIISYDCPAATKLVCPLTAKVLNASDKPPPPASAFSVPSSVIVKLLPTLIPPKAVVVAGESVAVPFCPAGP